MKTNKFWAFIAIAGVTCSTIACGHHKVRFKDAGGPGEDIINLSWDAVLPSYTATYVTYAVNDITISGASVALSTFPLTQKAADSLQNVAMRLGAGATGGYVTAVEIQYGIDTNSHANSFDLYIRPLYLTCSSTTPGPGSVYTYTATAASLSSSNPFYLISSSGKITQDVGNRNVIDAANYEREIRISHYYHDPSPVFTSGQDIQSVIYPFQEIDTVMKANSDTLLTLINVGFPVIQGSYPYIRQSLFLQPPTCTTTPCSLFPQNCCADQGNVCPPQCPNEAVNFIITTKY